MNAPKITLEHIEDQIICENYFTAAEGVQGSMYFGTSTQAMHANLKLLTFCVLTLKNGFTVTGESACAHPNNFNANTGREIARAAAIAKIWPLEGYLLKQHLHDEALVNG